MSRLVLVTGVIIAGCASPGTPRPPSLHLPQPVSDLVAERVGDQVHLHWTTPAKTTDGLNVETPMIAQLCRQLNLPASGKQESCTPVRRLPTQPGPAEATDQLPPALAHGSAGVLEYRIEILNRREHSAGPSAPVLAPAGVAPPLVAGLRTIATAEGALLQWTPEDAADQVELYRLHQQPEPLRKPAKKHPGSLNASDTEPAQVHLLATRADAGGASFLPDAGGTLDRTVRHGETYTYTAQRVRRLSLNGQVFELRGDISPPVTLVARDAFPPRPPIRVEAIAAANAGTPGIDLSWIPSTEPDLAGYLVYRADTAKPVPGTPTELITPALVLSPAFRDTAVQPGHTYLYTVVAVDQAGNRSAPSEPAREEAPIP